MVELKFEEIDEKQFLNDYTAECSGERSDCCTRVCTRDNNIIANEVEWGKFLEIQGGVIQY